MRSRIVRFRLLFSLAVVLMILLATALPALAQTTDTPTPGEVGSGFLAWLEGLFMRGVGGGALVLAITQIVKLFVPYPARYIQLAVAIVVWLLLTLGRNFGFQQTDQVYNLLEAVMPHVVTFLTSLLASGGAYVGFRALNMPGLGYSRSRPSLT